MNRYVVQSFYPEYFIGMECIYSTLSILYELSAVILH